MGKIIVLFKDGDVFKQLFQKSANDFASKISKYVTLLGTHMTWRYTCGRTGNVWHKTWQLSMSQWKVSLIV